MIFREDFLEEVMILVMEVGACHYTVKGGGGGLPDRGESRSKVKEMDNPGDI